MTYLSSQQSPFPRYGAAVNSVSSKEGDIYVMGGLIDSSTVKGDLWMIEAGQNMSCYPLPTTAEGPGPRVGHSSLLVGNAFIVYGGDTKVEEADVLDETLYLLNTCRSPASPCRVALIHLIHMLTERSDEAMVKGASCRSEALGPIRPLPEHFRIQNLRLRRTSGGLLHE